VSEFGSKASTFVVAALIIVGMMVVLGLFIGFPIKWLWNAVMPELFGLSRIGFWQAVGLFMLAQGLFTHYGGNNKSG